MVFVGAVIVVVVKRDFPLSVSYFSDTEKLDKENFLSLFFISLYVQLLGWFEMNSCELRY